MRLIDADKLIYQSHAQHIQPYINKKDIDNAPTVEMAEDCIGRNTLKRAISELTYWHPTTDGRLEVGGAYDNTVYKVEDVWRLTRELPPVTPQPKRGQWISIDATHSKCEKCEAIFEITSPNAEVNFCPSCGVLLESEMQI